MRKGSKSSARLRTHVWLPSLNFRVAPRPAHTRRSLFSDHLQREIARGTCPCTLSPATTWYVWESDTAINGGRRAAPDRQMWYRARGAIVGSVKYGPTELKVAGAECGSDARGTRGNSGREAGSFTSGGVYLCHVNVHHRFL